MKLLSNAELFATHAEWLKADHSGQRSGIKVLDDIVRLDKGDLVVIVGNANHGKSTFIQYYTARMATAQGWNTLYINYENDTHATFENYGRMIGYETTANHIFQFSEPPATIGEVVDAMEQLTDIDCVVIDPFSNLLGREPNTYTINDDLATLQATAKRKGIVLVILCHPSKAPAKRQETMNIYSALGSGAFAQRADVALSIETDFATATTTIKVDKLRCNHTRGEVNAECTLIYDKETNTYTEGETPAQIDEILGFQSDIARAVAGIHTTPATKEQGESHARNAHGVQQPPHGEGKHIDFVRLQKLQVNGYNRVTDKHSVMCGLLDTLTTTHPETKERIEWLRAHVETMTKREKQDYKKSNIPALTISAITPTECGHAAGNVTAYTNLICLDVDEQDNEGKDLDELKEIVNGTPYTIYSAESVSGKGIYALWQVEKVTSDSDLKEYIKAIESYMRCKGVNIDRSCKDVTRMRYVTFDPNPYTNQRARVWEIREHAQQVLRTSTPPQPRHLNDKARQHERAYVATKQPTASTLTDRQKIEYIVTDCKAGNLIINPTHADTLTLSAGLANTFGEDGWQYFVALNTIKHGSEGDGWKYESDYNDQVSNPDTSKTFASVVNLYKQAKQANGEEWQGWQNLTHITN